MNPPSNDLLILAFLFCGLCACSSSDGGADATGGAKAGATGVIGDAGPGGGTGASSSGGTSPGGGTVVSGGMTVATTSIGLGGTTSPGGHPGGNTTATSAGGTGTTRLSVGGTSGGGVSTGGLTGGGATSGVLSTGGAVTGGIATGGTVTGGAITGGTITGSSSTGGTTGGGGAGGSTPSGGTTSAAGSTSAGGSTSEGGTTNSGGFTSAGGTTSNGGSTSSGGTGGGGSGGEYGFSYRVPTSQTLSCPPPISYSRAELQADWLCTFHAAGASGFVYVQSTPTGLNCTGGRTAPIYATTLAQISINGQVTDLASAQLDPGGIHGNDFLTIVYQGRTYKFSHSSFNFGLYKCQPMDCLVVYAPGSTTSVETDGCTPARTLPEVCVAFKANGTHAALSPDPFKKCADDPNP